MSSASSSRRDQGIAREYESGASLRTLASKYLGSPERISDVLYVLGKQGVELRPDDRPSEWQGLSRKGSSFSLRLPGWLLEELGFDPVNDEFEAKCEVEGKSPSSGNLLLTVRKAEEEHENASEEEETATEKCIKCGWEGAYMQLVPSGQGKDVEYNCPKCGFAVIQFKETDSDAD